MNFWDILILAAVAAAAMLALYRIRRRKKTGNGCCGSCEGCMCNCPSRREKA